MAFNTLKYNHLTPLHFKGLNDALSSLQNSEMSSCLNTYCNVHQTDSMAKCRTKNGINTKQ